MYGKAWIAIAYAGAIALQVAFGGNNRIDPIEWLQIGIAIATAIGVYMVPITSHYKWVKSGVAVLLAVLQEATTLVNGWQPSDWITLVIAGLGGIGVILAPATSVDPSGTGDVSVPLGADD